MKLIEYAPVGLKNYIKLIKCKRKFKHAKINTPNIKRNVYLGKGTKVNSNVELMEEVKMGDFSYINCNSRIGKGTKIGKYCSVGYDCKIGLNEHPRDFLSTSPSIYAKGNLFNKEFEWDEFGNPVTIGNDVWIGSNVVVMQGVNIADGAIIAAGAVVTKDVMPYSIVGGVPAKEIKKRFEESEINELLDLRWWNMTSKEFEDKKGLLLKYMN